MPTSNRYTPVAPVPPFDWSAVQADPSGLPPTYDPTAGIGPFPFPVASGGRGPIQYSTSSRRQSSNRHRGPKAPPVDFRTAGPDQGMAPILDPSTGAPAIPAMPTNPINQPHPMPLVPAPGAPVPVVPPGQAGVNVQQGGTADGGNTIFAGTPGVPLVNPMDGRTFINRMGIADPAAMREAMMARRSERLGVNQQYAQGAVLGSLASLLTGHPDAGAYFRNMAPAMTGLRTMIDQDMSARAGEDAQHAAAVQRWYDTALKGEEMGAKDREGNQDAVLAMEKEATARGIPRNVHNYEGADGKVHTNVEYFGGRNQERTLQPFMPDAADKNADATASNVRLTTELGALRDSRTITAELTKTEREVEALKTKRLAASPEEQGIIDSDIAALQRRLANLEGEQNHLQQSMTKFGYRWGKGTPGYYSGGTREGDKFKPAPTGGGYNGAKKKGGGV